MQGFLHLMSPQAICNLHLTLLINRNELVAILSRCEGVYNRAGDLSVTRFAKEEQWNECEVTF